MDRYTSVGLAQYAMIFNNKGEFLILQFGVLGAEDENYRWVLPGGRVNSGETNLVASLKREIKEETSLEVRVLFPFATELSDHTGILTHKSCYLCKYMSGDVRVGNDNIIGHRWITYSEVERYSFIGKHGDVMFKDFINKSRKFYEAEKSIF